MGAIHVDFTPPGNDRMGTGHFPDPAEFGFCGRLSENLLVDHGDFSSPVIPPSRVRRPSNGGEKIREWVQFLFFQNHGENLY